MKYYILRTDRPGKIVPSSFLKSKLQTLSGKYINSETCFSARKGDLFKSMPSVDQPDDDHKIKVMSVDDSSKILEAETVDLNEIQKDAADLLLPIADSDKRYMLFSKRNFVSEALARNVGEKVIMKHEGEIRHGKIKRIGPIKEKDGTYFEIEVENDYQFPKITRRKLSQGKGTDVTVAVDALEFMPKIKFSQNGVSKSVGRSSRTSQKIEKYDSYKEIKIGTKAAVYRDKKPLIGTIKFIGRLASHEEMTFGIELDTPDGNTRGIWYGSEVMKCEYNYGLFVKADEMITEEQENFEIIGLDGSTKSENLDEKMDHDMSDAKFAKHRGTSEKVLSDAKKYQPPSDAQFARPSSTSNVAYHSINGMNHANSKLSERGKDSTYVHIYYNHLSFDRQRSSISENYHPSSAKLPKRGSENALSAMSSEVNHVKTESPKVDNYDPSLQIDSLVHISINGVPKYGLIKWMGFIEDIYPNERIAGLELEEPFSGMGDGIFQNKRYFTSPPGRAFFVKLSACKKDERFTTNVAPSGDEKEALCELQFKLSEDVRENTVKENDKEATQKLHKYLMDKSIKMDDRTRIVLAQYEMKSWGRAEVVIKLIDKLPDERKGEKSFVDDCIAAANATEHFQWALRYMEHECPLCYKSVAVCNMSCFLECDNSECRICDECFATLVTTKIEHIYKIVCFMCNKPKQLDVDNTILHFQFLSQKIKGLVEKEWLSKNIQDIFEEKLRDFSVKDDPNFRWCAHCPDYGFLWEEPQNIKMYCTKCKKYTCFLCKEKWEDQHTGISCEEFRNWKIENDPENQMHGLQNHLAENEISDEKEALCELQFKLSEDVRENIVKENDKEATQKLHKYLMDKSIKMDDRAKILLAQYELRSVGRAKVVIKLIDKLPDERKGEKSFVDDCIAAANANEHFRSALRYMEHECPLCYKNVAVCNMSCFLECENIDCQICDECFATLVTAKIEHIYKIVCPMCNKPKQLDEDNTILHFQLLSQKIKGLVEKEWLSKNIQDMFEEKLRDFSVKDDPNFRWCAHVIIEMIIH